MKWKYFGYSFLFEIEVLGMTWVHCHQPSIDFAHTYANYQTIGMTIISLEIT